MRLTKSNYFSWEMQLKYMSASQFKSFEKCEAAAMSEILGTYEPETSTALLVGSYVDAYFDKSLAAFQSSHPEIFKKDGSLKADYLQANDIIDRVRRDEMFMRYMSGRKQVVMAGKIEGVPVKIRMDSYHIGKCIVDLKVMRDFAPVWTDSGKKPFVEAWGYDIQGAIYREIEGNNLPVFLAAVTKEKEPDIAIISIPDDVLDDAFVRVKASIRRYEDIKRGKITPERCGKCDYCRKTKVLTGIVDYRDLC